MLDPSSLATQCVVEVDGNEAITSMALVHFSAAACGGSSGEGGTVAEPLLVVGTAENLSYFPTDCTAGHIRVYRWGTGQSGMLQSAEG